MDLLLILILLFSVLVFVVLPLWAICTPSDPISEYELDDNTCWQMRRQGYNETEIQKFMEDVGGHYEPPEDT
ncbi:hypothetical protein SLPG_00048 [Salicola phage CGphi29]|uniref:hypothetical protein n=1 Tax=Salicola phage CGphi29 TaxID=754067 RepID=UPI0002C0833F|nr:hypothetical protein SLPG_00048 [Salicola phage CGphi29]AGH31842.1 hypothetical protein SLPG_00048 [Salicola phage CGphi29]